MKGVDYRRRLPVSFGFPNPHVYPVERSDISRQNDLRDIQSFHFVFDATIFMVL